MSAGLLQMFALGAFAGFDAAQGRPPTDDERAVILAELYEALVDPSRDDQRPPRADPEAQRHDGRDLLPA